MQAKALIILADGFEDIEAITPIDLLTRAGINVVVAGLESARVRAAKSGLTITAPVTLAEVIADDFTAVILPGGPGADLLAHSSMVQDLVLKMHNQGRIIAAICAAPALILAPLGLLNNKKATCFLGMEGHFPASATFTAQPVVCDGNIITSRGAGTAFAFGLAIIEVLAGRSIRDQVAQATVYPLPPA